MYTPPSYMSAMNNQHAYHINLQSQAHVFTAACMLLFALGLQMLPARRWMRALWAFMMSSMYLYVQPYIYATSTQPQSIGIASVAMMVSWTILDWGVLQPSASRPTALEVYKSLLNHVLFGVIKVHKRRTASQRTATPAAMSSTQTIEGPLKQHAIASKQQEKHVFHVYAVDSSALPSTSEVRQGDVGAQASSDAEVVSAYLMFNSEFDESATQLTSAMMVNLGPLIRASLILLRLVVVYDVGYALLCCTSGNMWKKTYHEGDSQGLLGAVLGPKLAYYAFHYAVSFLLPLQMGIAYASLKVSIILFGSQQLADSLPDEAFNSPVSSTSVSDLWGNRWHQFLRYYFQGLGYSFVNVTFRPLIHLLAPASWHKSCLATARSLMVFAMSGLWHEYITWAAYGVVTGNYMAFFMLHGLAVVAESYAMKLVPQQVQDRFPYWLKRVYATTFMVLTTPLFTVPYQQHGYLQHCFHPFLVPVATTAARWAGVCGC